MERKSELLTNDEMIKECEILLHKIFGIISARIITNALGEIIELHILADSTRGPKQIARDVQSALLAKYNVVLDHKVISIAQVDEGTVNVKDFRLSLNNIQIVNEGPKVEIKVMLSKAEQIFEGKETGGNSINGRPRLVAEAVLNAIHNFLNAQYIFILADIQKISIAGSFAYIVSVGHICESGEELLLGSAIIRQDENESIVKATLDAVNRKIVRYYSR